MGVDMVGSGILRVGSVVGDNPVKLQTDREIHDYSLCMTGYVEGTEFEYGADTAE